MMCKIKNLNPSHKISAVRVLFLLFIIILVQVAEAQTKVWPVPATSTNLKNPVPSDPLTLKEGKALYTSNCTPCHGDKGKGDGPAAVALNPKPADHSSAVMLNETDGSIFYKISEGRSPMPTYKNVLTENQRWELVDYIRTLNKTSKK